MKMASAEQVADHERDLRKHDPRPTDPPTAAIEIAMLVQGVGISIGARLIEQYAQTVAAGARLDGVQQAFDRMNAALDGAAS